MNDKKVEDELLDEIAVGIRNAPVPDYPGPPLLNALANAMQNSVQRSSVAPDGRRASIIAVSCSLVALLAAAIGLMACHVDNNDPNSNRRLVNDQKEVASNEISELIESPGLKTGPVLVSSVDPTPEFDRMTDQLDRLDARLHALENEVALGEVQTDAATLLAEYTLHKRTVW
ncbi:MAG: hypothetical protein ABJZ55_11965 [Fuerstiella sp.]